MGNAEIRAQRKMAGRHAIQRSRQCFDPLLKDTPAGFVFRCEAWDESKYEPAVNPIIDFLVLTTTRRVLRHAGTLALARIGKAEPVLAFINHHPALRIAAVVTLRRMPHPVLPVPE
jgi:hypothetical protein